MNYLIPKNIKVKREIFRGFGFIELVFMGLSFGIGFLLSQLVSDYQLKLSLFSIFPFITFFVFFPLPNNTTILKILMKFFVFRKRQKKYKYKN